MRVEYTLDGLTFDPRSDEVDSRRTPRRVFSEADRARLEADPHLRPYAAITQTEVAGLLYVVARSGAAWSPAVNPEGETLEASRALADVCGEIIYKGPREPAPPLHPDAVFDAAEQDELSYRKGVQGMERITRQELVQLLRAVDRFALSASYVDVFAVDTSGLIARWLHAHNVLVGFRERPMTLEELGEQTGFILSTVARNRTLRDARGDQPSLG